MDKRDLAIAAASKRASEKQGRSTDVQQWGGALVFNGMGDVGTFKSLINIQLPDGGPTLACVITPPTFDSNPELLTGYPLTAKLAFGCGLGQTEALIDCAQGVCFALPASFLRVDVRIDSAVVAPSNLRVRGWAVKGDLGGSVRPLYRSQQFGPIAPAGVFSMELPLYTRRYRVWRTLSTTPFDMTSNSNGHVSIGAGQQCPWIDVVQNQRTAIVTNTGLANLFGHLVCELNL